jgi:hypothetical protein
MIGITLTSDQIRTAPTEVRQWIEHQVIASLGLGAETPALAPDQAPPHGHHLVACSAEDAAAVLAQIQGFLPAVNVFFEFGRAGINYGQPPVMAFRLLDILHHTRLQNVEQVMTCLDAINQALAAVRRDDSARFCGFDNQGHCLIAPQTQQSIFQLWQGLVARQQAASDAEGVSASPSPAPRTGNGAPAPKFMPPGYVKTGQPVED